MSYVLNFYSGVEPEHHYKAACWAGVQNMLMSYLYLIKNPSGLLAERHALTPNVKFMIDSGAHTLQCSMTKAPFNKWKMRDIEQFLENYLRYLDSHKDAIYCAVELDIAYPINVVNGRTSRDPYGTSVVNSWRRDYFEPLMAKGMNIVFVWHTPEGHLGWEDMCAKYPYVGLPGEMSSQMDFGNYLSVAQRYTTRIHGFAATKMKDFKEVPWYSIDSSVAGDSLLKLRRGGKEYSLTIEELYAKGEGKEVSLRESVSDLPDGWETLTIDDELQVVWKSVPHVVRHTVRKAIYTVQLADGKEITGTGDHSFFTLNRHGKLVEVKPQDMKLGDYLVGCNEFSLRSESLKIASVEKTSEGEEVEVYDLTVPGVERFIANGVLAHNTSWKAGEIYGTLPVWIERTQKLKFASKGEREPYRYIFEELGLNADAVIDHTDYSEVTRASLRSMSAMEEFYRQLYAERIFYYEQRLPPPHLVAQLPSEQVWDYWLRCFDARRVFKPDSRAPLYLVREWLQALASVQYGQIDNLSPRQQKFLARSQIAQRIDHTTLTRDLQRTLSLRISPINRTPLARLDEDDDFSFHRLAAVSRGERDYKATRQSLLRSEDYLPELQAPDAELPATLENELLSTSTQELLDGLETDRGNPVPEQFG